MLDTKFYHNQQNVNGLGWRAEEKFIEKKKTKELQVRPVSCRKSVPSVSVVQCYRMS